LIIKTTKASITLAFLVFTSKMSKKKKSENYLFAISFLTITAEATIKAMIRPSSMTNPEKC